MVLSNPKKASRCAVLVALLVAGAAAAAIQETAEADATCLGTTAEAIAAEVLDARSLRLEDGRVVRLAGIEPFGLLLPEPGDADAKLQRRLADLVSGATIRILLVSAEADRYGRLPAMIAVGGLLVQEKIAHDGLAIAFASGEPLPCFDRILAAEAAARRAHRGFWMGQRLPAAFPRALAARIGRFAIFEGRVVSVGNRRARSYLNFGTWWSEDVTAEITAEDRERFGGEAALGALAGHRVRMRGFLEEKSGPMMVVRSPMQLELLDRPVGADGSAP